MFVFKPQKSTWWAEKKERVHFFHSGKSLCGKCTLATAVDGTGIVRVGNLGVHYPFDIYGNRVYQPVWRDFRNPYNTFLHFCEDCGIVLHASLSKYLKDNNMSMRLSKSCNRIHVMDEATKKSHGKECMHNFSKIHESQFFGLSMCHTCRSRVLSKISKEGLLVSLEDAKKTHELVEKPEIGCRHTLNEIRTIVASTNDIPYIVYNGAHLGPAYHIYKNRYLYRDFSQQGRSSMLNKMCCRELLLMHGLPDVLAFNTGEHSLGKIYVERKTWSKQPKCGSR